MPQLDNPQYEKFAIGRASGKSLRQAYAHAGFKAEADKHSGNALVLAKRPEVAARIKELQADQAQRIGVTVDSLVREYDQMIAIAKKSKQAGAGVGAISAKAALLGFNVNRTEHEVVVRKPMREPTDRKSMSIEEWQEAFTPAHLKAAKPEGSA